MSAITRQPPPTPPFEHEYSDLEACETGLELLDATHLVYHTPDDSPNPTNESMGRPSAEKSSAKRVDFVLTPSNIAHSKHKGTRLEELKPKRSILKQSVFSSDPVSSDCPDSVARLQKPAMLEQMVKGLASEDISARFDAYQSINGCLKAYNDLAMKQSIAQQMPLLDAYLRRDLAQEYDKSVRASQTTTEALRLATTICWLPETKQVITTAFQVFLLNHTITVLSKEDTPKALANGYLYFLSVQNFSSRIMNQEKVNRLLPVIKSTVSRITGRQANAHALTIYKRLIGQAKAVMAAKASLWIEELFRYMVSTTKEVRERAIQLGLFAAQTYGTEADVAVSDAVRRLMNTIGTQERKFIDVMITRLQTWLDSKQDTAEIPSIWSIVILLLRSRKGMPQEWEHLVRWLRLLQGCLNISDSKTRTEGNLAWIRLIYTLSPQENTSKGSASLLFRPIKKQLELQERERNKPNDLRTMLESAYTTLLYYAFRPRASHAVLDRYWQEFVLPVFASEKGLLLSDSCAYKILMALFGNTQRPWNEQRALDTDSPLVPSDLPRLDSKWIRSRSKMIFDILGRHLNSLEPQTSQQDCWKSVWTYFYEAVSVAASKEIKVASDTMNVVAQTVATYRQLLQSCTSVQDARLDRAFWLIDSLYHQLGDLPFIEDKILVSDPNTEGEIISTVTSRTGPSEAKPSNALTLIIDATLIFHDRLSLENDQVVSSELALALSAYLPNCIKLMRAGYKQLSVEVRHAEAAQAYTEIWEHLEHLALSPSSICRQDLTQLSIFARWLSERSDGSPTPAVKASLRSLPSLPSKSTAQTSPIIIDEQEDDTIVLAKSAHGVSRGPPKAKAESREGKNKAKAVSTTSKSVEKAVTTPEASKRKRGGSLHQQPRIRHDNSQIEFASIDSSPSLREALDSQLLTERQKEVRERQDTESIALFRDISSSLGPKSRTENTPRLQLSGHDRASSGSRRYGSSSPILPPGDSTTALLGSSPTPSQRNISSERRSEVASSRPPSSTGTSMMHFVLDDPPSSPPMEALDTLRRRRRSSSREDTKKENQQELESIELGNTDVFPRDSVCQSSTDHNENETPAIPPHFLSTVPKQAMDIDSGLVPARLEESENEILEDQFDRLTAEMDEVDAVCYAPDSEDRDLISSQFEEDLRRASQCEVIVEAPGKRSPSSSTGQNSESKRRSRRNRKRASPASEEQDTETSSKRAKRVKVTEPEVIEQSMSEPVSQPQDLVVELQALLEKAKSGLDAQQGLAVLRMSAELTQLAVKAVHG